MSGEALVLYARAPCAGRVKTRMLPWLHAREALLLHEALFEDSLHLLRRAAAAAGAAPFLSMSETWTPSAGSGLGVAAEGIERLPQSGGDLGIRLLHTFRTLFDAGRERVVIIGSDSPTLSEAIPAAAFTALQKAGGAALGPADDGGYYLVGAASPLPDLFSGIPWGTDRVLSATLARLHQGGHPVVLLPPWFDVDRPRDLERLRVFWDAAPGAAPRTRAFIEGLVIDGRLPLAPDSRR